MAPGENGGGPSTTSDDGAGSMHGAAASAQHSSTGSATRSADRMAQLEDGQGDSGGDASMPLCLREEEGEGEEDDQTSLVPLALEQNRTLNGMVTRLVNQRTEQREAIERLLHGALAAADAETYHLRSRLREAQDAQATVESEVRAQLEVTRVLQRRVIAAESAVDTERRRAEAAAHEAAAALRDARAAHAAVDSEAQALRTRLQSVERQLKTMSKRMEDMQRREQESKHTAERLSDELVHAHAVEAEVKDQKERAEAAQHRSEHALHAAQAAAFELRASLQSVEDQAAEVRLRMEQARAETVVEHTARTEAEAHARAAEEQHQRDVEEMQAFQRALSGTLERVETAEAALACERVAASRAAETAEEQARERNEQLQAAQSRCSQLTGEEEAIQGCSLEQLHALMQAVEMGGTKLRRAVLAAEVEAASRAEAAEAAACAVCFTRRRDTALNCGHLTCQQCAPRLQQCPICRAPITSRNRVFI